MYQEGEGICLAGPFLSVCFNTLQWTYFASVTLQRGFSSAELMFHWANSNFSRPYHLYTCMRPRGLPVKVRKSSYPDYCISRLGVGPVQEFQCQKSRKGGFIKLLYRDLSHEIQTVGFRSVAMPFGKVFYQQQSSSLSMKTLKASWACIWRPPTRNQLMCTCILSFWVIHRRLNFIRRRFGILCLFHLYRRYKQEEMRMEETECSETSAYKIQTPGNRPKERIQHSEHGEILKSRIDVLLVSKMCRAFPSKPGLGQWNYILFMLLTLRLRYYFI
jgi:hypothetical protein